MNTTNIRKTFAIIAHPDAGKTTLTEKLLLFGGAINMAGAVKAKGEARRAKSDWMKVERERGISVASSVMTYEYSGCTFNLLDTPGHEDFSEDTYRVLTAVDSAVMVIDGAKGIETQTRKLFQVCRLRDMPIITFINKMDREARDPFEILDEIEQELALDVTPASFPIGMGKDFLGCYDLINDRLILTSRGADKNKVSEEGVLCQGINDPKLDELLPNDALAKLRENVEMAKELCKPFDMESYLEGTLTPVYFGSAVNNFGVRELLDGLTRYAPAPRKRKAFQREVSADENKLSGFVFKIQANMDPKHRDRIAFFRICSGSFKQGMKMFHVREGKQVNINNPIMFMAQDREIVTEAYPGDIMGIISHGNLMIGDTLTEGEKLNFTGIPSFAPEMLQRIRPKDPLKAKHLTKAMMQIAEEGGASVLKPLIGAEFIVGVIGQLQFDVIADRIKNEYDIPVIFESCAYMTALWIDGEDKDVKKMVETNPGNIATDFHGGYVFMPRNAWHIGKIKEDFPNIKLLKTREVIRE
ncbi:MAG: Peptide chain release factor 3 [Alphaproteobacteria bacterium ADurb.Bin438]|nr:MAG: Peptide chain release factor 3 [Alphaproteobacteria bacterium ADurb.Bin438]